MYKANSSPWRSSISGPIIGYEAKGYLGQTLVIYPEQKIVAVRMVQASKDYNPKTDGFGNFSQRVYNLATADSKFFAKQFTR